MALKKTCPRLGVYARLEHKALASAPELQEGRRSALAPPFCGVRLDVHSKQLGQFLHMKQFIAPCRCMIKTGVGHLRDWETVFLEVSGKNMFCSYNYTLSELSKNGELIGTKQA